MAPLRVVAVLLGLGGIERIIYADILSILPGMAEPTPSLDVAMGLLMVTAAGGLFLGYGWARWPSVLGAAAMALQGLAYLAWSLSRSPEPAVLLMGLIEPMLAVIILDRLLRHWPPGITLADRVP